MVARLTDRQKKRIIAEYVESSSYNATAKKFGIAESTVRRLCKREPEITRKAEQKREQNTADMLSFMESRKEQAKRVLDNYLKSLDDPEKIEAAKLSEVATAMGIVMDKFINNPLKHQLDQQKLEIELIKLESQLKDSRPEEEEKDNFLDALNGAAGEVWEGEGQ